MDPELRVVFIGTERGIEARVVPARGYELELVHVLPIRGLGVRGAWRGAVAAVRSLPESDALLKKWRPSVVLTVGGYAAGPVSALCRLRGIPLALLEPNAVMGLSNRLIAPFIQRAYTAFAEAERHVGSNKVVRAGVPIRSGFDASGWQESDRPRHVLVLGGSQGARTLNENVPQALAGLAHPVVVRHQCGKDDVERVRALYVQLGVPQVSVEAFIDDVPEALRTADIVISRSGASAVSEICAIGRASLLVPYPFAAGNHQERNAVALAEAGAARWVANRDATPERLRAELESSFGDARSLRVMADAARALGRPDAAAMIAKDLVTLAGWSGLSNGRDHSPGQSKEQQGCFADA
jgi:UDP-N-acetylglucosamine--N-acetylmuramyl-(pentapeptide) pyrophosphoryl-undecaprenol N-acetylglucosamine transferase